eukprot:NODE_2253_length_1236_cov_25.885482_g2142_i0.p1 GENE.NODE_2253_length_1236_cov_25.885482_g2142_i0~~NODE_2253_length_1236_cov_25.885482_g2142_i0.p1  ORF type:complete len:411 (-),score=111.70 NODE_2253_length_1236_cov_25.885482_g2142_i0:2-1078(-)
MMTESFLHDLCEYKTFKKSKGVNAAAKSMIHLYRELEPMMLKKKLRGKFHDPEKRLPGFGAKAPSTRLHGIELLQKWEKENARPNTVPPLPPAAVPPKKVVEDILSDNSGDWIDVSDDDASHFSADDSEISDDNEDDECPELLEMEENSDNTDSESDEEEMEVVVEDSDQAGSQESDSEVQVIEGDSEDDEGLTSNAVEEAHLQSNEIEAPMVAEEMDPAATRFLTEEDFERIKQLEKQASQNKVRPCTLRRREKKEQLRESMGAEFLELGTERRIQAEIDKRVAKTQGLKEKYRSKLKNERIGGGTTNKDKQRKKSTVLVRNKKAISSKRRMSSMQKSSRAKKMRKTVNRFHLKHHR